MISAKRKMWQNALMIVALSCTGQISQAADPLLASIVGIYDGEIESTTMVQISTEFYFDTPSSSGGLTNQGASSNVEIVGVFGAAGKAKKKSSGQVSSASGGTGTELVGRYRYQDGAGWDNGVVFNIRVDKNCRGAAGGASDNVLTNQGASSNVEIVGVFGAAGKAKKKSSGQVSSAIGGTATELCITGIWQDSYGQGPVKLTFSPTRDSFSGYYRSPGDEWAIWDGSDIPKSRRLAETGGTVSSTQAEAEKQKQAELAALEETKASTTELPPLEPMDRAFVVQQTTNIRTEPKVLAARAGRVTSGDTLTILAKVSGQDWYLVETDNGERGFVFAKALASTSGQQGSAAETAKSPAAPKIDFGKYYALVIGNNTYRALPDLHSAVNDARAVGALLESDYGFEVEVLLNATRSETYSTLARMRRKVGDKDNLLIYYAGHGWLDKDADEGYWMPTDAEEEDAANWISSGDIIAAVRRSKAKHIMVVADSCFSGTLTRGLTIKSRTPGYLERMAKKKARTALTSGGLEPVMDSGGGNHSVFAQAFLSVLKENDAVLDGHQLFTVVRKKVMVGSEQTPEYGDLRKAGHDGGDFLFVKR